MITILTMMVIMTVILILMMIIVVFVLYHPLPRGHTSNSTQRWAVLDNCLQPKKIVNQSFADTSPKQLPEDLGTCGKRARERGTKGDTSSRTWFQISQSLGAMAMSFSSPIKVEQQIQGNPKTFALINDANHANHFRISKYLTHISQ